MPNSSNQSGVVEKRNYTLKKMIRSMMFRTNLPESLSGEAVKIALYILNKVPSKSRLKTPVELWVERKPSPNHFYVWGYRAKVRIYNPSKKKRLTLKQSVTFLLGIQNTLKDTDSIVLHVVLRLWMITKFLELDVDEIEHNYLPLKMIIVDMFLSVCIH